MVDSNEVEGKDLVLVIDSIAGAQGMVGVNSSNNLVCAENGVSVDVCWLEMVPQLYGGNGSS